MSEQSFEERIAEAEKVWPLMMEFILSISEKAGAFREDKRNLPSDIRIADIIAREFPHAYFGALGMTADEVNNLTEGVPVDLYRSEGVWALINAAYHAGRLGLGDPSLSSPLMSLLSRAGREGGKKTGAAAAADADERWRILAKEMIDDIRAEIPGINRSKLATEIFARWPEGRDPPPYESLIKSVIRPIYQAKKKQK